MVQIWMSVVTDWANIQDGVTTNSAESMNRYYPFNTVTISCFGCSSLSKWTGCKTLFFGAEGLHVRVLMSILDDAMPYWRLLLYQRLQLPISQAVYQLWKPIEDYKARHSTIRHSQKHHKEKYLRQKAKKEANHGKPNCLTYYSEVSQFTDDLDKHDELGTAWAGQVEQEETWKLQAEAVSDFTDTLELELALSLNELSLM